MQVIEKALDGLWEKSDTHRETGKEQVMQYQLSEKERQILEHEFVYQDRKVGVIGGYCEDGFPLYYANDEIALMLGYADVDDLEKGISGMVANTIHPEDFDQVMKDLNGGGIF